MKGKLALATGLAIGYVLGARAGRNRYNQIKRIATNVWEADSVQSGVGYVQGFVGERLDDVREFAGDKIGEVLKGGRGKSASASRSTSRAKSGSGSKDA